jgi:hypothetical protein
MLSFKQYLLEYYNPLEDSKSDAERTNISLDMMPFGGSSVHQNTEHDMLLRKINRAFASRGSKGGEVELPHGARSIFSTAKSATPEVPSSMGALVPFNDLHIVYLSDLVHRAERNIFGSKLKHPDKIKRINSLRKFADMTMRSNVHLNEIPSRINDLPVEMHHIVPTHMNFGQKMGWSPGQVRYSLLHGLRNTVESGGRVFPHGPGIPGQH